MIREVQTRDLIHLIPMSLYLCRLCNCIYQHQKSLDRHLRQKHTESPELSQHLNGVQRTGQNKLSRQEYNKQYYVKNKEQILRLRNERKKIIHQHYKEIRSKRKTLKMKLEEFTNDFWENQVKEERLKDSKLFQNFTTH